MARANFPKIVETSMKSMTCRRPSGPGGALRRLRSLPWYIFSMHPFPPGNRIFKKIKGLQESGGEYYCYAANMNNRTGGVAGALPRQR
jgi:hypothetical protein